MFSESPASELKPKLQSITDWRADNYIQRISRYPRKTCEQPQEQHNFQRVNFGMSRFLHNKRCHWQVDFVSQMSFSWQKLISLTSNSFSEIITILKKKKKKTGRRQTLRPLKIINRMELAKVRSSEWLLQNNDDDNECKAYMAGSLSLLHDNQ